MFTSSTSPPSHCTHLSSFTIPHLFLLANSPAELDHSWNLSLTAIWPSHELTYLSGPLFSLTILYNFRLPFFSTSSHKSYQFSSSICSCLLQAAADPLPSFSKPYFLSKSSYSSLQPTPPTPSNSLPPDSPAFCHLALSTLIATSSPPFFISAQLSTDCLLPLFC